MRNLISLLVICTFIIIDTKSQDLLNPYDVTGHQGKLLNQWKYESNVSNFEYFFEKIGYAGSYNGEYQVSLRDHFWNFNNLSFLQGTATSLEIEVISFPFTLDCGMTSSGCADPPGTPQPTPRSLYMPSALYNSVEQGWEYTPYTTGPNQDPGQHVLSNISKRINAGGMSDQASLVSGSFILDAGFTGSRIVFPHTIIKHTINLHCGNDISNNDIVQSFTWIYDNTRGRMRSYPFRYGNFNTSPAPAIYDVLFLPEIIFPDDDYPYNMNDNKNWINGGSVNQYPFDAISNTCNSLPAPNSPTDYFHLLGGNYNYPFFPPYSILSTFLRSAKGHYMAGYDLNTQTSTLDTTTLAGIRHQYFINENIDLTVINPNEKIIYNPSEVNITTNDFVFPTGYTFKTIRGLYATLADVALSIGVEGNYHDLRDVPVYTDLTDIDYGFTNDNPTRSSRYYIKANSKLTIEPCVTIYDAVFILQGNGELVFQDRESTYGRFEVFQEDQQGTHSFTDQQGYTSNYKLIDKQGMVTRPVSLVPQGNTFLYESNDLIESGTAQQLPANLNLPVTIAPETHVVFVAENEIKLTPGFHAKADHSPSGQSVFHALIWPSHCAGSGNRLMASNTNSQNNYQPQKFLYPTNPVLQPNPSRQNSKLFFSILENSKVSVKLYNAMGQLVNTPLHQNMKEKGNHIVEIKTEGLQPGIYLCTLYTEVDGSKKPMQVSRKLVVE